LRLLRGMCGSLPFGRYGHENIQTLGQILAAEKNIHNLPSLFCGLQNGNECQRQQHLPDNDGY
jgi:hypothetical protein